MGSGATYVHLTNCDLVMSGAGLRDDFFIDACKLPAEDPDPDTTVALSPARLHLLFCICLRATNAKYTGDHR